MDGVGTANMTNAVMIGNEVYVPVEHWDHLKLLVDKPVQIYATIARGSGYITKPSISYLGELNEWHLNSRFRGYIINGANRYELQNGLWLPSGEKNVVTVTKEDFEARRVHVEVMTYNDIRTTHSELVTA